MYEALRDFMKDEIEEEIRAAVQAAVQKERQKAMDERVSLIRNLMQELDLSAEQVMTAMKLPKAEQTRYAQML